jgi:prevent-host-death family protein
MKQVRIAELKSRLSEYLRVVRHGETISVFDRETPVAHIVPLSQREKLRIRKPRASAPPLNCVPLAKPLRLNLDVVKLLLEERQGAGDSLRGCVGAAPGSARTSRYAA